jgi:hypothetical protein
MPKCVFNLNNSIAVRRLVYPKDILVACDYARRIIMEPLSNKTNLFNESIYEMVNSIFPIAFPVYGRQQVITPAQKLANGDQGVSSPYQDHDYDGHYYVYTNNDLKFHNKIYDHIYGNINQANKIAGRRIFIFNLSIKDVENRSMINHIFDLEVMGEADTLLRPEHANFRPDEICQAFMAMQDYYNRTYGNIRIIVFYDSRNGRELYKGVCPDNIESTIFLVLNDNGQYHVVGWHPNN